MPFDYQDKIKRVITMDDTGISAYKPETDDQFHARGEPRPKKKLKRGMHWRLHRKSYIDSIESDWA